MIFFAIMLGLFGMAIILDTKKPWVGIALIAIAAWMASQPA